MLRRFIVVLLLCSPLSLMAQFNGGDLGSTPFPNVEYKDSNSEINHSNVKRDPNFTIKVNSEAVAVDVVAIGSDGHPVLDLKPSELSVKEDGKKRSVSSFLISDRSSSSIGTLAKLQEMTKTKPQAVVTNFQGAQTVPSNGCTVLLIDQLNTSVADQAFSRENMLKFLAALRPDQPVAIYVLGNNLIQVQDFTTDVAALRASVGDFSTRTAEGQPGSTINSNRPIASSMKTPGSAKEAQMQGIARYFEAEVVNAETDKRVDRTVKALAAIARRVEAVDGRKNLIWLSSAFPIEITSGDPRSYGGEVEAIGHILATANVALYPIDARGLISGSFDATVKGNENGMPAFSVGALNAQLGQNAVAITNPQRTMELLADETGGRAFYNTNDLSGALQTATNDGSSFYALSFKPANASADGSYHTVQISTTRKGVQLRYRKGYYASDAAERDEFKKKMERAEVEQALLQQHSLSTGLPLMAQLDHNRVDVVDLWIHGGSLSILNDNNKPTVRLEVAAVTFDHSGNILTKSTVLVGTGIKMDRLNTVINDGLSENVKFEHRPDATRLRIAIRDIPSGRIGTIDIPLEPQTASNGTNSTPKM